MSDIFKTLHPGVQLPHFYWLKVEGAPGQDDFGMGPGSRLGFAITHTEVRKA